jgi:hypothetical protein
LDREANVWETFVSESDHKAVLIDCRTVQSTISS